MTLERTMLQRDLVAIRGWIENVKTTIDETDDPEERADCVVLLNLYSRKKEFIESKINLPFLAEQVKQRRAVPCHAPGFHADNPWTEEEKQQYSLAKWRLEEAEVKLACAERSIEDWTRLLPEWQETYKLIVKRIEERAEEGVTGDIVPERQNEQEPESDSSSTTAGGENVHPGLNDLFQKSDRQRALALAILDLNNPEASAAECCLWLDEHPVFDLPKKWMSDGNDRSFALAYDNSDTAKRDLDSALNKAKAKLRKANLIPRLQ
jgi:hypothetical protein